MMSCIFVFYISVFGAFAAAVESRVLPPGLARAVTAASPIAQAQAPAQPDAAADAMARADEHYKRRDTITEARQAEAIWAARLKADPRDFTSAWKLARVRYWLGGHAEQAARKKLLEDGIAAARVAAALEPSRPEGHFWIAANMGALAESFGLRQGLKYRGDIRDALLRVLEIDPAFQQGSADRALGRWYFKVPGLFGGSSKKSEAHLRKSLTYNPGSTISHFFLAETLLGMDRKAEAIQELQRVIDAPIDPEWAPEDREYKDKAQRLLTTLMQKKL